MGHHQRIYVFPRCRPLKDEGLRQCGKPKLPGLQDYDPHRPSRGPLLFQRRIQPLLGGVQPQGHDTGVLGADDEIFLDKLPGAHHSSAPLLPGFSGSKTVHSAPALQGRASNQCKMYTHARIISRSSPMLTWREPTFAALLSHRSHLRRFLRFLSSQLCPSTVSRKLQYFFLAFRKFL